MGNMSYCRFENTYRDLNDCREVINEDVDDLSESEAKYRKYLINCCRDIVKETEDEET